MAKETNSDLGEIISGLLKASFFELPIVAVKRVTGIAEQRTVTGTAWRGYDAAIQLGSASIDRLYENPLFRSVVGQAAIAFLRWQRVNNAWRDAFFAALWRAMDIPTASTVEDMREEIRALAAAVRAQAQEHEEPASQVRHRDAA